MPDGGLDIMGRIESFMDLPPDAGGIHLHVPFIPVHVYINHHCAVDKVEVIH
jgi:hypothetical protein